MANTKPSVVVRYGCADDLPRILATEHECFDDALSEKDIVKILKHNSMWIRVARIKEQTVGHAVYMQSKKRPIMIVDRIGVMKEFRRMGAGMELLTCILQRSRSNRQKAVEADLDDNALPAAHALFKACGFRFCLPKRGVTRVFCPLLPTTSQQARIGKIGDVS
jgi:ribosomal protein S18 acetylase RimI-like enzyme